MHGCVIAWEGTLCKSKHTFNSLVLFLIYERYASRSPPAFSSDDNNRACRRLKHGFEWQVDALRRQCGRGWQAAVTVVLLPHKLLILVKLQASPGWSLLPVPHSLHPSIHPFIYPSLLGLLCQPLFSFLSAFCWCFFLLFWKLSRSNLISFHSSFTVIPQLPLLFLLPTFSFIEKHQREPEDVGRLLLNTPDLSALEAGHTGFYDFAPNSIHLNRIARAFGWNSAETVLICNGMDVETSSKRKNVF